jgi:hypothetical protein
MTDASGQATPPSRIASPFTSRTDVSYCFLRARAAALNVRHEERHAHPVRNAGFGREQQAHVPPQRPHQIPPHAAREKRHVQIPSHSAATRRRIAGRGGGGIAKLFLILPKLREQAPRQKQVHQRLGGEEFG